MESSSLALIVVQFGVATLLPAIVASALVVVERRGLFKRIGYWPTQAMIGLIFGLIAIYGTEAGIKTTDATMNVRDAAPIVAGLFFGGPAGIVAGLVGGIERWFAALWGRGMFTRWACSIATIFAGFYSAALRRFLFEERRPSWLISFSIGMVAEVLHLLLVFALNMSDVSRAFAVVKACLWPMVCCNALAVAIASVCVARVSGVHRAERKDTPDISHIVQTGMLVVVSAVFMATMAFVFALQSNLVLAEANNELTQEIGEVEADIQDASDANLLSLARQAAKLIPSVEGATNEDIAAALAELDLAEINVVNEDGIIVASNVDAFMGFDMASGEQSAEFLTLLTGTESSLVQPYQAITADNVTMRKYAGVKISGGFLQVGYDAARFTGDLTGQVRIAVAHRRVGTEGFMVVLDERGYLVASPEGMGLGQTEVSALASAVEQVAEDETFRVTVQGVDCLGRYAATEGLRVLALLPVAEAQGGRDLSLITTSFMEVLAFAALFLAIYVLIRRVVVQSIWQVNGRLGEITQGDLDVEVDVRESSEFASLSDDINATVSALRGAIEAEARRNEEDLRTAAAIQESALPRTFPPFPDIKAFDIYASMNPAREVGGDFYDFFLVDDHTLCFLIADVSGKGIPASLFMMEAKSELANHIKGGIEIAEAVQRANWNLCQGNDAEMFVTMWAATLDWTTGVLSYVNAGHNPPLLRHAGRWQWLEKRTGAILGVMDIARYRQEQITLVEGDQILLYTDGVNEAFNLDYVEYGNDRLEAFVTAHADLSPRLLCDMLAADLRSWAKDTEQSDDITMVCLQYGTSPEISGTLAVPATKEGVSELMRRVRRSLKQLKCPEDASHSLEHAVEELACNVYEHGEGEGEVLLSWVLDPDGRAITMSVTDTGRPFDPTNYVSSEHTGGDEVKGMGIALAIGSVDDIAYVRDGTQNITAFRKSW